MPKGNPNPSPATRFSADNPGRAKQKGARDRLSAAFLTDFAADYDANGKAVIETVRGQDPVAYMRIAASLLPKQIEITEDNELARFSDDEIEMLYEILSQRFEEQKRAAVDPPGSVVPSSQRVN